MTIDAQFYDLAVKTATPSWHDCGGLFIHGDLSNVYVHNRSAQTHLVDRTGWTIALSVNQKDLAKATEIVGKLYREYGLCAFQFPKPPSDPFQDYSFAPAVITLHDAREQNWPTALQQLHTAFLDEGVSAAAALPGRKRIARSPYAYYAHDGSPRGTDAYLALPAPHNPEARRDNFSNIAIQIAPASTPDQALLFAPLRATFGHNMIHGVSSRAGAYGAIDYLLRVNEKLSRADVAKHYAIEPSAMQREPLFNTVQQIVVPNREFPLPLRHGLAFFIGLNDQQFPVTMPAIVVDRATNTVSSFSFQVPDSFSRQLLVDAGFIATPAHAHRKHLVIGTSEKIGTDQVTIQARNIVNLLGNRSREQLSDQTMQPHRPVALIPRSAAAHPSTQ